MTILRGLRSPRSGEEPRAGEGFRAGDAPRTGEEAFEGPRGAEGSFQGERARSARSDGAAGGAGWRERPFRSERPSRRSFWRPRYLGAAAVGTVGWGVVAFARLVMAVATLIALLIALAIVLRDVDANSRNTIVKGIHEGANFFAGAFTGLVTFKGHPKREITVDWGVALAVYLVVGAFLARWIGRVGRSGLSYGRTRRLAS